MFRYRLIDFGVKDGSCTGRFRVQVGEGTNPFEAKFTGPVTKDGSAFMKAAGVALMTRHMPSSKFEGDLEAAVGEEHVWEILDPSKEPQLLVDDAEGDEVTQGN